MSTEPGISTPNTTPSTTRPITTRNLLIILRVLWLALVAFEIRYIALNIPHYLYRPGGPTSPLADAALDQFYGNANLLLNVISSVLHLLLSGVLMWRIRNERAAIIFSFLFAAMAPLAFGVPVLPVVARPVMIVSAAAALTVLYLLPDGRFVPRWTGYVCVATILTLPFVNIRSNYSIMLSPQYLGSVGIAIASLIYRYRQGSTLQRQQLKWLILITMVIITWVLLLGAARNIPPSFLKFLVQMVLDLLVTTFLACIPLVLGFVILRYRLWEVDLIINRSLVYSTVTVLLGMVFAGIIALVSVVVSRDGTIIGVVAAAVAAGALFNPARKAIQHFVDRRIYHLRFDQNELAAAQEKPEIKNPGLYTGRTFGKYAVLGVLGRGGMGEMYKGHCNGQVVAIKILPQDLAGQGTFVKRFQREVEALSALDHPNIVRLFGSGVTDEGVHFLVMEFIEGPHLGELTKEGWITDYDNLGKWLDGIAAALDYIHGRNLVHRDLKPSNVMLRSLDNSSPQAVLMDFGLVRTDGDGTRITGTGAVGTIDYMAPEQIMEAKQVDARADIYALGVMVFELTTGERPFKGGVGQVMFAHLQQPPPDPRDINPDIPRSVARTIARAMAKNPEDRFQSAGEFAAALS